MQRIRWPYCQRLSKNFLLKGDLENRSCPVKTLQPPQKLPYNSMSKDPKLNRFARFRNVNNIKSKNKDIDNSLIIIEGCVESDKKLKILIDNGSQVELISKQVALDLGKSIRNLNAKLATVNSEMTVIGEVQWPP